MLGYGGLAAFLAFVIDRLSKWWFIDIFELPNKGVVEILPIFDVVMVWNRGVSFGFLDGFGRWPLITLNLVIVCVLIVWLIKAENKLLACSLGLVIGGAIGNIYDRLVFEAVADFFQFHWENWYFAVFNVADSFIFIGAVLLVFNSSFGSKAEKQTEED